MIDGNLTIATLLDATGLPVFYEYFIDADTPIPCVTYRENNNSDYLTGDTLSYSNLSVYIKVWGYDIGTITINSALVDTALKAAGYKRTQSNMSFLNGIGQNVMKYEAVGFEKQ